MDKIAMRDDVRFLSAIENQAKNHSGDKIQ